MKVDILDIQRLIDVNKLQEVSSPMLFSNKMMYDPNGILSNEIFGISKDDRRNTFAYIDLRRKFIHPHVYDKLLKPLKGFVFIVAGQRRYSVVDGQLVEDENGWTGIANLYKHWDEIDWNRSKSSNVTNKELLVNLMKDQIFLDKWPVNPPAYRDVLLAGTVDNSDHVAKVNDLYTKLIRSVGLLSEGGLFAQTQYGTQLKIQEILVEIYKYFKEQVARKNGLIRKYLLGKTVDYGVRAVISAPAYNNDKFKDNIVDFNHSAVPIEMCCSLFYPFIEAWLKNFFTREIINDPNMISFYNEDHKKEFTATIKDADVQFSDRNIRKMINNYMLNPDNRFNPITVEVIIPGNKKESIGTATMLLKGKEILENNATKILNRALTLTDIMYLACCEVCEHRHIMTSRYPVGTDKGIFFSKIRVQSTARHVHLIFNGKEYPHYPYIDFSVPHDRVGIQFVDTLVMSNSHLDSLGADSSPKDRDPLC